MQEGAISLLVTWQTFYVLVGTAAATLTGLMFVVVTLLTGVRGQATTPHSAFTVFNTPNVWHFGAALLVAALLSVPWEALWPASLLLGLTGLVGVSYVLVVFRRMNRVAEYQPVLEDWLFHTVLPLVSYAAFISAALLLLSQSATALFVFAAATLLLLFIGIHNAWDNVTYIATQLVQPENKSKE